MSNSAQGYITDLERVCEIVSDWYVDSVLKVSAVLMPDGRPFDYVDDPQARMRDYLALRGDPAAWSQYLLTEAESITQKLQDSGLPEDQILSVHPYDLAQKFAVEFSAHMEGELTKHANTINGSVAGRSSEIVPQGSGAQSSLDYPA